MLTIQVSKHQKKIIDKLQRKIPEYCTAVNVDYFDMDEVIELVVKIVPAITPVIAAYFGYLAGKSHNDTIVIKIDGIVNATITTVINGTRRKLLKNAEMIKLFLDELNKSVSISGATNKPKENEGNED